METTEKELEDRLRELGNWLASPPSDVDELLRLLDQTEIFLSRVEQSPSISMTDALRPAMSSLITKEFLNHPETDVKVFVAACINEITRITAPEAPYNDILMKEVFTMIVDSFGELDDISGRTYSKRVSILETMAKVRSCVVMLDLECNDLILQMFKHFLKTIRVDHPINVFSSMETIMALVLEESEDISQELLLCLLSNVQKSKKDTMPVAHILAKKVVGKCAMKLKPFISVAVQSMDASLSDLIASICQENSCAPEQNEVEGSKLSEVTVSKGFPQESEKLDKAGSSLEKVGNFADKTRKVMSNGVIPLGNGNPVVEPFSAGLKPEHSFSSDPRRNDITTRGENDNLGSIAAKPDSGKDLKHTEAKSSPVQLTDTSGNSHVDGDNEASALTIGNAGCKRETKSLKLDDASNMVPETEVLLEPERDAELRPLEGLVDDNTCTNSINPSDSPSGSGHTKRGRSTSSQLIAKKGTIHKPASTAGKKRKHKNPIIDKDSEMKSLEDSATVDIAVAVITDAKSSARNVRKSNTKQSKGKEFTEGVSTEPSLKEMMIASSKASRAGHKGQNPSGKHEKSSSGKKRQREVTSGAHGELELNEDLVGSKIEVWWPDDKQFYSGVIDAFDPKSMTHMIVYDDGDTEDLLLKNEQWKIVDAKKLGHQNDIASSKSLRTSGKKRRASSGNFKATPESGAKLDKMSKATSIQHSGKSRGRPKREISKVNLLSTEETSSSKEQAKVESTNNSDEPSADIAIVKHNTSSRGKSDGKSKGRNILLSRGESAIRSRERPRDETSKIVGSSKEETLKSIDKHEGTVLKSSQTNNSDEGTPEYSTVAKDSASKRGKLDGKPKGRPTLTSARRKSGLKFRSKGATSKRGSTLAEEIVKTQGKDEGINSEFSEENNLPDDYPEDTTVGKDSASKRGKLDGKPKGRPTSTSAGRKSGLKFRSKGGTSKRGSTLGGKIVKTQGKDEGIKSEFSEENNLPDDYPENTTVGKSNTSGSGSKSKDGVIATHEKLKGEHMMKPDNKSDQAGRKRKGTAATTHANVSSKKTKRGKMVRV